MRQAARIRNLWIADVLRAWLQYKQSIESSDGTYVSLPAVEQPVVKKQDRASWDVEMRRLAVPWDFVAPLLVLPHLCSRTDPTRKGSTVMLPTSMWPDDERV